MTLFAQTAPDQLHQRCPFHSRIKACIGDWFIFRALDDGPHIFLMHRPQEQLDTEGLATYAAGHPNVQIIENSRGSLRIQGPAATLATMIEKYVLN